MCLRIFRGPGHRVLITVFLLPAILSGCVTGSGSASGSGGSATVGTTSDQDSRVVRDAIAASDWIAVALRSSGYKADFSVESLREIDRFLDDHSVNGKPKPGGLLAEQTGARLFALGAYVGEVLRRSLDGTWHGDDADPEAEINIEVHFGPDAKIWPVQKIMKRFVNGPEDSIYPYARVIESYVKSQSSAKIPTLSVPNPKRRLSRSMPSAHTGIRFRAHVNVV